MSGKYKIEITTTYKGLDQKTLDNYLLNTFQQNKKAFGAKELRETGKFTFSDRQPDGTGKATTTYLLTEE